MAGISGVSAGIVLAGRYTLSRRLWHRGIGELWLASDSVRRRRVWIQITASGGLENAVSALTHVTHPAIAVVREAGQKRIAHEDRVVTDHDQHSHKLIHKSDSYIEFAVYDQDKGTSLTARLMKGALTSAEIGSLALSAAEVFEAVHAAGLVHGWLHTDSMWAGSKGHVFVDLALGLAFEGDAAAVAAEASSGFLTPARIGGAAATAADDVYALGWLLYAGVFGWEILREDWEFARGEVAGAGVAAGGVDGALALLAYRREMAVGRLTEYFEDGSALAEVFAHSLSDEAGTRPSMTEIVAALRRQPVAELAPPAIVAERAAVAAAAAAELALAAEALGAEVLGASVEDADSAAWTPAVSPTANVGVVETISVVEAEAATAVAVAETMAAAEERHAAELESVRAESQAEADEAALAAAVAAALAEAELQHRAELEAIEARQAAAIEAAVAAALAEAAVAHAAELAAARAEATVAAEAEALAEVAATAETRLVPAQRSAGSAAAVGVVAGGAAGLVIGEELAVSETASGGSSGGSPGTAAAAASPKPKPWLLASGGILIGVVVGIGIGYAVHGSGSSTTSAPATHASSPAAIPSISPGGLGNATASASAATASNTASAPTTAASAPTNSGPTASAPASAPGNVPTTPNTTPNTAPPTTPQQSLTQITTIITTQVSDTPAKTALIHTVTQLKGTRVGSNAYTQILATLTQAIATQENQGAISHTAAQALRQQVGYLQAFSGS